MDRRRWWMFALLLGTLLVSMPLQAGEVVSSHVSYEGGHYLINIDMRIRADPDKVFAQLMDFNHLRRINGAVLHSRLLGSNGNNYLVRVVTRGCLWFFCRKVVQVENVEKLHNRYLISTIDPKMSDFKFGRIVWHVWRDAKGTRVRVTADLVPKFWIPPLIGPWVMKDKLLKQGRRTIVGLERLDGHPHRPGHAAGRPRTGSPHP